VSESNDRRLIDIFELPDKALKALAARGIRTVGQLLARCPTQGACEAFVFDALLYSECETAAAVWPAIHGRMR
jgi:hypothetical protein